MQAILGLHPTGTLRVSKIAPGDFVRPWPPNGFLPRVGDSFTPHFPVRRPSGDVTSFRRAKRRSRLPVNKPENLSTNHILM